MPYMNRVYKYPNLKKYKSKVGYEGRKNKEDKIYTRGRSDNRVNRIKKMGISKKDEEKIERLDELLENRLG